MIVNAIKPVGRQINRLVACFISVEIWAMAICERLDWPDSPEFKALVQVLRARWPSPISLTCETVGLNNQPESRQAFLLAVQSLADDGLLQYEALLVGPTRGPEVVDALLTARGRALLDPGLRPH